MNLPLTDEHLRQNSPAIDMDANTFREIGHRLIDDIADLLSSIAGETSHHFPPASCIAGKTSGRNSIERNGSV